MTWANLKSWCGSQFIAPAKKLTPDTSSAAPAVLWSVYTCSLNRSSFHWMEAIIMFVNAVAEIFVFPIPLALHRIYELWMIAIHVGGHCGFEMFPFIPHMGQLLWVLSGNTAVSSWVEGVNQSV
jgi:hypothetical protein